MRSKHLFKMNFITGEDRGYRDKPIEYDISFLKCDH